MKLMTSSSLLFCLETLVGVVVGGSEDKSLSTVSSVVVREETVVVEVELLLLLEMLPALSAVSATLNTVAGLLEKTESDNCARDFEMEWFVFQESVGKTSEAGNLNASQFFEKFVIKIIVLQNKPIL